MPAERIRTAEPGVGSNIESADVPHLFLTLRQSPVGFSYRRCGRQNRKLKCERRHAFHEEGAQADFGGSAKDRFRDAVSALEKAWPIEQRYNPFHPFVTWTKEGPRLGAATLLARKGRREEARLLALMSVACGFALPMSALTYLFLAEGEFDRDRFAKSAMYVAVSGVPALRGTEGARRLYFAAGILDAGFFTPVRLMRACGLDCGPVESLSGK